jgi:H+-translocating NAD(P) transhydrogenase subunit alpha
MRIRVHLEALPGERRVALTPRAAKTLIGAGHSIALPAEAGERAGYPDSAYEEVGCDVFSGSPPDADLLVGIGPLTAADVAGAGAVIGFLDPLGSPSDIAEIASTGVTAISMELIPRTTLAQTMDALSSQATAIGYQAALLAASELPRFFPMMMTAAGTVRPARVLVLGAGVAGLQALATARRLGAVVSGYDIRPAAREQVESLGASFVGGPVQDDAETAGGYAGEVDEETRAAQLEALAEAVAASDAVITTAQVPGRTAPILVAASMVEAMRPGSIIVDTAASTGGNCELTVAGEVVEHGGVTIHGPLDLAARTAGDASEMYAKNVVALLTHLTRDGDLIISEDDEIGRESCVTRGGEVVSERVRAALEGASS